MTDGLLDVKDVQARLRVSERTVFTLIKKGELHGFKVGHKWRFSDTDIQDYENRQRRKAEEERIAKTGRPENDSEELPPAA